MPIMVKRIIPPIAIPMIVDVEKGVQDVESSDSVELE